MEPVDLLIVGAGWHGLAVAKTYLEANPNVPRSGLAIMDDAGSIGGTWAKERLYPGLKTNNIVGSYEFSDFPLSLSRYGLKPGQHVPGDIVHRYLSDFAEEFKLMPLIRFCTNVTAATLQEDGTWLIDYTNMPFASQGEKRNASSTRNGQIVARRMVVATGLTSEPHIPDFPGRLAFKGHFFHSKELKTRTADLMVSREVMVIGGNKSAWDVCYASACSGAQVHMVIRPSGGGPSWVWRPLRLGYFATSISRLSSTRFFSFFDPTPFGKTNGAIRSAFRQTALGQLLCWLIWSILDMCSQLATGYGDEQLRMIRPWASTFWMGNSLSIHNYETNWFDYVRNGQIKIHHAEVISLNETTVCLSDGDVVDAEAVVTCTGWESISSIKFGPPALAAKLSLSGKSQSRFNESQRLRNDDEVILEKVRKQILKQCPELRSPPVRTTSAPSRGKTIKKDDEMIETKTSGINGLPLYRFMVPPEDTILRLRNLAFAGTHQSPHTVMVAQAQALWITAFFSGGRVTPVSSLISDKMRYDAYFDAEYQKIRRPKEAGGACGRFLDLVFDSIPYIDLLLEDLGMRASRKSSWWRDTFEPYTLSDYEGLVQEWVDQSSRN